MSQTNSLGVEQGVTTWDYSPNHVILHTHTTCSLIHSLSPQHLLVHGGHLLTHLFLTLLLLKSKGKLIEGVINTVFLGPPDTNSNQCSYINKSTGHCTLYNHVSSIYSGHWQIMCNKSSIHRVNKSVEYIMTSFLFPLRSKEAQYQVITIILSAS